jgi:hypothetical protein
MSKPLCMDDAEYAGWVAANERLRVVHQAPRPCSDCPLAFYEEMQAAGTCDGAPWMREKPAQPVAKCGAWMERAEEPCARGDGHAGPHRTASAHQRLRSQYSQASRTYRQRHAERVRAKERAEYAAEVGRPVRVGFGRPRVAA